MANKVGKAKEAALQFFKTANPQDEFFLVSFNDRAEVMSAFTSPRKGFAIRRLKLALGNCPGPSLVLSRTAGQSPCPGHLVRVLDNSGHRK